MADFRKWLIAFAAIALLLSLGTSANAQGTNQPGFTCFGSAVPATVRAEGRTELVGDLVLNCTGGTPTVPGNPIPQSNVQIFLSNTSVTSRLYAGGLSEAILSIDEPFPSAGEAPVPNNQVPQLGAPTTQNGCQAINQTNCSMIGTGGGIGATGPYAGTTARSFNIFQGLQNGINSVVWLGVPIDAPGTNGTRVVRITNIRADACALGVSANALVPTQILMFITIQGSQQVSINFPQQTVAFIVPGLTVKSGVGHFVQCINIEGDELSATQPEGQEGSVEVSATENFASAFKTRIYAQEFNNGTTPPSSLATAGLPPSTLGLQNILGFPYNTESGYVSTTPGIVPNGALPGDIGSADAGTQVQFTVAAITAGVSFFIPSDVTTTDAFGTATGHAVLVGSTTGAGTVQITPTGSSVTFAYEIWYDVPNVLESLSVDVDVAALSNTGANMPGVTPPGTPTTIQVSFSPQATVAPNAIPRFCPGPAAVPFFTISFCQCNLLFPFVTNQAGFDTGIAIANTSLDPFGTPTQNGTVTLNYFGNVNGTGAAPAAQTTTSNVNAGTEVVFNLSMGGDHGIVATPGFQGYVIATANFQFCHAFAFISDVGAQKLAEGYLAIQLDEPFDLAGDAVGVTRTGQSGENLAH